MPKLIRQACSLYDVRCIILNKERFPEKFCFQLNQEELLNLRSHFETSSLESEKYGGRRYLPYVFTEQGIAMLSGLLKNDIAIKVSINIMDAFVELRRCHEKGRIHVVLVKEAYGY